MIKFINFGLTFKAFGYGLSFSILVLVLPIYKHIQNRGYSNQNSCSCLDNAVLKLRHQELSSPSNNATAT